MSQEQLEASQEEQMAPALAFEGESGSQVPPTEGQPLLRRLASIAGWGLLIVVSVVVALLAVGPITGKYRTLTVLSGSMRPYMEPGDVVVITQVPARSLRQGDVITYYLPGTDRTLVSHRISRIIESGDHPVIETKGDANNAADKVAQLEDSRVWRVRMVTPKVGWVLNALRAPKARLVGTVLAPILLLAVWLVGIWGKREDDEDVLAPATIAELGAQAPAPVSAAP